MKALLIDSAEREVRAVEYEQERGKGAPTLQEHIGGYIETAFSWDNGDVLFVDEEGLFKPQLYFFRLDGRPDQPLAGNGIVVGKENYSKGGDYIGTDPPEITADELLAQIEFRTRDQVDAWAKANASNPAAAITFFEKGEPKTEVIARVGSVWGDMPRPTEYPVIDATLEPDVIGVATTEQGAIEVIKAHFLLAGAPGIARSIVRARVTTVMDHRRGKTIEAWLGSSV